MNSLPPSEEAWPPPVFRELAPSDGAPGTTRTFELVDVGALEPAVVAVVIVDVTTPTWWLADGWAASPHLALRLVTDVRAEAVRRGAAQLATRDGASAAFVAAARAAGGRDEGKQVFIDV